MSYVNLDARATSEAAAAAIDRIVSERQEREAAVADAVIAFCSGRGVLGLRRGKIPVDRSDAVRMLETKYGFNEELLADLSTARRLHADRLHELQHMAHACAMSLTIGDGRIMLSLHHASMLQPASAAEEHK